MSQRPSLPPGGSGTKQVIARIGDVPELTFAPPPSYAPPPPSDWQRYLAAVRRAKWTVLFVTLAGTAAGVVATRWLEPQYRARAILWIEGGTGNLVLETGDEAVKAAGWTELLSSNAVLDSAVNGLRLYLRPAAAADSAALTGFRLLTDRVRSGTYRLSVAGDRWALETGDGVVERGALGDTVGRNLGFAWLPPREALAPGRSVSFTLTAPSVAARDLAAALKLHPDPEGKFLRIELRGTNPALTAATVNAVARRAVAVAAELERQKFEELAAILREQYDSATATLRTAERDLEQYQIRNADVLQAEPPELLAPGAAGMGGSDPAYARSFEMRVNLEQLRRDRQTLEQVIAQSRTGQVRLDALPVIESVRQSPRVQEALEAVTEKQAELRALKLRYTDASAPVQLLQAELDSLQRRTLPVLLGQVASEMSAREAALTPQVNAAFGHLRRVPTLALEQARRSRDVTSALELVAAIRQKYDAVRLAVASTLPDMRVLDPAVEPRRPEGNYGSLLIALSFVTSLGLAVVGVTLRDRVDTRVRFPEQITRGMRLEILGAMPHLSRRSAQADGDAEVIEALRGLRLRVLHAHGAGGPLALTVTSPAMGDGKSIVSVNLALSFAHAGYETLLIDGDLRRGNQHGVLGERARPGLTDLLAGQATVETVIRKTQFPGLSLLPAGTRMMRAPELLLSPDLNALLARFRERYSVVVVDSPPLAAGVDPIVLGTATRDLLLVLRSGATDLALTMSKLDVLETLPLRVLGAVLNDVRSSGAFRYYTYDVSGYVQPDPGFAAVGPDGQTRFLGGRS